MRLPFLARCLLLAAPFAAPAYETPMPDVSGLSAYERMLVEESCKASQDHQGVYRICLRDSIKALKAPGKPDLSSVPEEDRERMDLNCARRLGWGADSYHKCLARDMEELARESYRPNMEALTPEERAAVEKACEWTQRSGVGMQNGCLRREVAKIKKVSGGYAELRDLNDRQRAHAREVCDIVMFEDNPAKYSACLSEEAAKITGKSVGAAKSAPAISPRTEEKSGTMSETLATIKKEKKSEKELPWGRATRATMPARLAATQLAPDQLFARIAPSVYVVLAGKSVENFKAKKDISQGSAIAVAADQLITNCHVVAKKPFILLVQERNVLPAMILGGDEKSDRCILRTLANSVTPVEGVRQFKDLKVGERVYTVGTPAGLERTLGEGLISGLRTVQPHGRLVQTTAPISPGSSGGGLFDSHGNLIGVTTFLLRNMQQLNFAIAAEEYWK